MSQADNTQGESVAEPPALCLQATYPRSFRLHEAGRPEAQNQCAVSLLRNGLVRIFALDPRSLAFLRIICGILLCVTRLVNLPFVVDFYTDVGMLPRSQLWQSGKPEGGLLDLFSLSGSPTVIFLLYALAIIAPLCLALGWKTRTSTVVCWLFSTSLYNRNPYINPASDTQLELLLLWGFFLPWGACWSLDHRGARPESDRPYLSWASAAWKLQVVALYLGASLAKTSADWATGTSVEISLRSDYWSNPLGQWLAQQLSSYPAVLPWLTHTVVLAEFCVPLLLLLPWVRLQMVGLGLLTLMHIGFGFLLNVEMFSPVALGCLVGFLPAAVWNGPLRGLQDWLQRRFDGPAKPLSLPALGPVTAALVSWGCLCMLWSNANSTQSAPVAQTRRLIEPLRYFRLSQSWGMFVPAPAVGGWYRALGTSVDGSSVDLLQDGPPAPLNVAPMRVDQHLPSTRYYLFFNAKLNQEHLDVQDARAIAASLRRRWERRHPQLNQRLREVKLYRFVRQVEVPGKGYSEAKQHLVYQGAADPL